jgi:hypothetical protein
MTQSICLQFGVNPTSPSLETWSFTDVAAVTAAVIGLFSGQDR